MSSHAEPLDLRLAFRDGIPPIPWLAQPWLVRREIHNLIGQDGVGKSLLALDMAVGVATGTGILGGSVATPTTGRVMYVDRDSGAGQTLRRIMSLLRGRFGEDPPEAIWTNLLIYCDGDLMLTGSGLQRFRDVVASLAPDLIFLDALRGFHDGDENSSAEMASIYRHTLRPMASAGPGIVVLHHEAKPSEWKQGTMVSRGSTEITAAADTNLRYYRDNRLGAPILTMYKARNIAGPQRPKPQIVSLIVGEESMRLNVRPM